MGTKFLTAPVVLLLIGTLTALSALPGVVIADELQDIEDILVGFEEDDPLLPAEDEASTLPTTTRRWELGGNVSVAS